MNNKELHKRAALRMIGMLACIGLIIGSICGVGWSIYYFGGPHAVIFLSVSTAFVLPLVLMYLDILDDIEIKERRKK